MVRGTTSPWPIRATISRTASSAASCRASAVGLSRRRRAAPTATITATGVGRLAPSGVRVTAGLVVEGDPKTLSSRRTLPLDDGLLAVLKRGSSSYAQERLALGEAHADSGYVAVNEAGQPYTPDTLTRKRHKVTKAAGVRPIRLHDARPSCGTALHVRGVPLAVIAKWLGHADALITARIYAHSRDAALIEAGRSLGGVVTSS
jgi:integrase